jgi:hypothetical protein
MIVEKESVNNDQIIPSLAGARANQHYTKN